jgi:hypothetical protein
VPRSWIGRKADPCGRRALEAWRCQSRPGLACRPNLAGWPHVGPSPLLLGEHDRPWPQNDPSMLLSFERPASAGRRGTRREGRDLHTRRPAGVIRLSTVLENCTEATSAAIDKRRLKNGYHRALQDRLCPACAPNGVQGVSRSCWARSPSR